MAGPYTAPPGKVPPAAPRTTFSVSADAVRNIERILRAARAVFADLGPEAPLLDSLAELTGRAQRAGLIRADLTPGDVHRILGMLTNVLWGMAQGSDGWRRYVVLILDALKPDGASPLPAAEPCQPVQRTDNCWPA